MLESAFDLAPRSARRATGSTKRTFRSSWPDAVYPGKLEMEHVDDGVAVEHLRGFM
jgi:hypothetical protein